MSTFQTPHDPRFTHLPPPPAPPPAPPFNPGFVGTATVPPGYGYPPPPPPKDPRRVEIDVRNLVLSLGVLCLVAAAVSFCAMNWESFDATMRASLLVGATVASLATGLMAKRRGLGGTATALSWLTAVLLFVDLAAVVQTLPPDVPRGTPTALGAAVLFGVFVLLGALQPGWAMRTGAALAWCIGWWTALGLWDIRGFDIWVLPLAAVIAWLQYRATAHKPQATSWQRYGAALIIAAVPAVLETLADPGLVRPVTVIVLATAVLTAGVVFRQLAAVWTAGIALGVIAAAQIFDALRGIPGWAVFALVGTLLIVVGAVFEYRLRGRGLPGADHDTDRPGTNRG